MPYNLNIPGQVSEDQLKAIELVASLVPARGHVVEVGSLFGRTSWAWAKSVDPSVTVHCIDPWKKSSGVRSMEKRHGIEYGLEQFKAYLADCANVEPHQGYSPRDFTDWDLPVDLYYEDAVHTDPVLSRNLDFWSSKASASSILCGDDYRPRFPDVRAGAQRLAERLNRELITVDFFWCLLPFEEDLPGASEVADQLRQMNVESDAKKRARGVVISVGPLEALPSEIKAPDSAIRRTLRVYNTGLDPWPEAASGTLPKAGIRIIDENGEVVRENITELPEHQLAPDIPVDVDLDIDFSGIPSGAYRVHFDVKDQNGHWRVKSPTGIGCILIG